MHREGLVALLRITALSWCLCWHLACAQQDTACVPPKGKPGCVCKTADGTIDLTSIANHHDKPLYEGKSPGDDYYNYTYNPCYPYILQASEAGPCSSGNISSCQIGTDKEHEYALGVAETETMYETSSGGYYLLYTEGTGGRSTKVQLFCNASLDEPVIYAYGDDQPPLLYNFDLHSKCCCPGACGSGSIVGLVGLLLMLFFFLGIGLYFLIGFLVLKFGFHKEGSDAIPNKEIWTAFPFLVKDGFLFTFGPCINKIRGNKYAAI